MEEKNNNLFTFNFKILMKRFLKRIIIFILTPLVIVIGLTGYISTKIEFKLDPDIQDVYVGDSHIQCTINDSLLNQSKNVAAIAESFYFSYYKLEKILAENPNVQKVYLGFGYHSLSNYYDNFINGKNTTDISPKYFYILPIQEKFRIIYWNRHNLSNFTKQVLLTGYDQLKHNTNGSFGQYANYSSETKASQKSMEKRVRFQYYTKEKLNEFSQINLTYLDKIIKLCRAKKIELGIINTPLHPLYESKIPEKYLVKYNELIRNYRIEMIDFKGLQLNDSCFFPDGDHVSEKGALIITNALINTLENNVK